MEGRTRKRLSRWYAAVAILIGAIVGAYVGGNVGDALYTPQGELLGDLEWAFWGAVIGLVLGSALGWLAWAAAAGRFRPSGDAG